MTDMNCIAWSADNSQALSGSVGGHVYIWENRECKKTIQIGTAGVGAIATSANLIAVGEGTSITTFDNNWQKLATVEVGSNIRSLDINPNGNILAGLRDGKIIELSKGNVKVIQQSHSDGELWGLAVCGLTGLVVTTADDNKILSFDTKANKLVSQATINDTKGPERKVGYGASSMSNYPPNQQARSVAINKVSGHVAVAACDGTVSIRNGAKDLSTAVSTINDTQEWIEAM